MHSETDQDQLSDQILQIQKALSEVIGEYEHQKTVDYPSANLIIQNAIQAI